MTGSTPFSIEKTDNFQRSFKKLYKIHGETFVEQVVNILEGLIENQYPPNSQLEPLPSKIQLPEGWTFHKLRFTFAKGASGQIRLMYLVNQTTCQIKPLWIYTHEQFAKRPPDKDLKNMINEALV